MNIELLYVIVYRPMNWSDSIILFAIVTNFFHKVLNKIITFVSFEDFIIKIGFHKFNSLLLKTALGG
jgi:hypothetical protein